MLRSLCAALLLCAVPVHAAVRDVRQEVPARDFGFFLGDVFTLTAVITADDTTVLDRASLPQPGPVSRTADIRTVQVTEQRTGGTKTTRIAVSYQNLFGPDAATQTEIPGYRLEFSDARRHFTATVPAWRYTVSALRHDVAAVTDPARLRPDRLPHAPRADAARLWLLVTSACAALSAAAFMILSGYGPHLFTSPRPFAGAAPRLRRLLRHDDGKAALLELHRAFDATAGRTVLASDVDLFVKQHAKFAPLRDDIKAFFAASRNSFFGDASGETVSNGWIGLFARRLIRAERG